MIQAIIKIGKSEDRILSIIKGKFGLKSKSDAVNFVILKYEEGLLEPELKPEFIQKIRVLEKKGKFSHYKDVDSLRKEIENA